MMRVTDSMKHQWLSAGTSRLQTRQHEAMKQATTGYRVNAPSDDPTAAAEYLRKKAKIEQTERYKENVEYVRVDLELAEGTLAEAGTIMQRVKEITVQASNGGTTPEHRASLADEVGALREAMLRLANTRGSKGSLFAGSQTETDAFDAAGVFQGDDTTHRVAVGAGVTVQANISGAQAFTAAGGRDIFADLVALRDALTANDEVGVRASMDTIDASHAQIVNARGRAGLVLERLEATEGILEQTSVELQTGAEASVTVEPHKAYSELVRLGNALETSIAVTRRLLDTASSRF